ncbi:large ribosomal subunit protein mL45 [Plodia interpunctella]|uniref:large ribosomal subunit protein mL45 n=1 Tax=Plodia interpunctella TaxID=58824 RepID=UPI0023683E83|nr:probable 39S ribosomal protein L45, mitochondrial [Plodia interpunctella]
MANSLLTKLGAMRLIPAVFCTPVRTTTTKHYNPKFKKLRAQKYMKIPLPDMNEDFNSMSKERIRQKMKERGVMPPRPWMERPFYISATGGVFEAYVPPEGDGKASIVSPTRAKQAAELLQKKSKSMMAIRKIKSFEEEFDSTQFASLAQDIYIKAHETLVNKDRHALRQYVTEKAYPEFRHNANLKTIRWKFLESLEPPRVVHARCTDIVSKENVFGQVTVRFHTRQQLSVYDRFGRLIHGSEIIAKDVLEYIVFEKHLSNLYGTWRIHEKIIPDWTPPKEASKLTRVASAPALPEPEAKEVAVMDEKETKVAES